MILRRRRRITPTIDLVNSVNGHRVVVLDLDRVPALDVIGPGTAVGLRL